MASDEVHLITYRMALASEGIVGECLFLAYSVEKLEKNGGMFFCRKPKPSELRTALGM